MGKTLDQYFSGALPKNCIIVHHTTHDQFLIIKDGHGRYTDLEDGVVNNDTGICPETLNCSSSLADELESLFPSYTTDLSEYTVVDEAEIRKHVLDFFGFKETVNAENKNRSRSKAVTRAASKARKVAVVRKSK